MHRLILTSLATAAIFVGLAPPSLAVLASEIPVITGRYDEVHATAAGGNAGTVELIAFTRKDESTGWDRAFLRTVEPDGSKSTIRLNQRGSGDVGGFFYGPRLLYAQAPEDGDWDLHVFNVDTGRRHALRGVNTPKDEVWGTRSGRYLLFNRDDAGGGSTTRVVLRDMKARHDAETVLARTRSNDSFSYAGQVRGNWALWTKCNPVCDVFRRDIAARVTTKLPKSSSVPELYQYDASVGGDGTVYLVRSTSDPCGSSVELVRFGAGDPAEGAVIAQIAAGRFTTFTYARPGADGGTDVFYSRGSCSTYRSDVYKVVQP